MNPCKCGSYAINPYRHGRGNDRLDLCDVCYWRDHAEDWHARAEALQTERNVALSKVSKDGRRIAELEAIEERLRKAEVRLAVAMGELRGYSHFADTKEVIDAIEGAT